MSLVSVLHRALVACLVLTLASGCEDDSSGQRDSGTGAADTQHAGDTSPTDTSTADTPHRQDAASDARSDAPSDTSSDTSEDTSFEALCDRIDLGPNADLRGERLFPQDSYWYQPVADAPVDPNSDAIIASIGADTQMHPDFGCCWGGPFGIPYVVVDETTPDVPVSFTYADESDPGPYPIPADAPIEGGADADGDRHVLVIDCAEEKLYEIFAAYPQSSGGAVDSWEAGSGAVWDLSEEPIRAPYCTSADAAGLPVLPGLVRYDEVEAGEIRHAIRFTVSQSRAAFVSPPASHWASSNDSEDLPPMGMRVRLKSDAELAADGVDVSTFSESTRVILRAMQTYGMILADNGSDWYFSGMPHPDWNDEALVGEFRQIRGRHFEVLEMHNVVDDYSMAPGKCELD